MGDGGVEMGGVGDRVMVTMWKKGEATSRTSWQTWS